MAIMIKCKMCGGDLALTEGSTIATCEYCGSQQTVPNMDDEKKVVLFERADRLRRNCEFDKAAGVYESIVADFRQEAEAYWGLVLCKYGIEYVDDPATGKKVPTCHRSSFESIMEDPNFDQVLENADVTARKVYRDEAKAIEEIRKGIIEVSSKEDPYDIFICYKETAEDGQRTLDSVLAQDIYDTLTDKGYRVFFSRITLEDKLGQEYEPYIFAALNSAKVMLAIGTDYEYYNAVWVKNEWSRYLKLMEKDKTKHLIPCFKGIDAYDMPKEFNKLQAQDMGKVGAMQDLVRGIDKLLSTGDKKQQVVVTDNSAMAAFLQDKADREAKEARNSRRKKVIPICIFTAIIGLLFLMFTGTELAGTEVWFLYELGSLLNLTGDPVIMTAPTLMFLIGILVSYILMCVGLGIAVKKGFRYLPASILMAISWMLVVLPPSILEAKNISMISLLPFGFEIYVYISCVFVFIMTLIMNWPPKKLRFWIALVLFAAILFGGNVGLNMYQTSVYNSALLNANAGKYNEAIESLAKLDDYKDSREQIIDICTNVDYLEDLSVGDTVYFGSYEQDNNRENGTEPIAWRVLESNGSSVLVISEHSLDAVAYHGNWGTDVTWETCDLRYWLENDFTYNAFSSEELNHINGSVTLLTAEQATNLFDSDTDRLCTATVYTERNRVGSPIETNGKNDDWWLRGSNISPSDDAPIVDKWGRISEENAGGNNPLFQYVRPAMWIKAQESAAAVEEYNPGGYELIEKAAELANYEMYMSACMYLERAMGEVPDLSSEDVDTMITMMNDFSLAAEERYTAWNESVEGSIDSNVLEEFDMMFTAMIEAGDFEGLLMMIQDTGFAQYAFAQDYIIKALEYGLHEYYSFEELAKICPYELLPVLDMHAAHITDIFNWVEGRTDATATDAAPADATEPVEY